MTEQSIMAVYEQYKHLDPLLSDHKRLCEVDEYGPHFHCHQILYDLWQAVKAVAEGSNAHV